ncbi:helix-turn-helix transcriptional regulator [Actinoplanes sp. NPDC049118]|uniref:helix-turn-helix domain-containing protein n=1 Tax=Actinoplanes sp. NPDC049118 TaxID=3155769 RepID=UPI00340950F4
MGQASRELTASASPRHFFGAELRRLREHATLSQAQLGALIRFSGDMVRRVETAERFPSWQFAEACDGVLEARGTLARLWPLLQQQRSTERAVTTAPEIRMAETQAPDVPGRDDAVEIPKLVRRVPFQPGVLDRAALDWLTTAAAPGPRAARVLASSAWASEADLRPVESALAMFREQDHTLGAGHVHVEVQRYVEDELNRLLAAAPASGAFGDRLHSVAAEFFELCGYQAVDTGANGLAQRRYLRALRLAQSAGDRVYGGYLLAVNIAHLTLHCDHPEPALRMALAAVAGCDAHATPAVRAALHAVVARAHARLGREAECTSHLRVAERHLDRSRPGEEPTWIRYFSAAYLADEMAHCFHDLGHPEQTQRYLGDALAGLRPSHVRRLAIDTALMASSLATSGAIDEACAKARTAVDHAAATMSYRCVQRIVDVQVDLDPYRGEPEVRELGEYVRHRLPAAAV